MQDSIENYQTARLVFDSLEDGSPSSDRESAKRRLVFEANDVYIDLQVEGTPGRDHVALKGTLLRPKRRH